MVAQRQPAGQRLAACSQPIQTLKSIQLLWVQLAYKSSHKQPVGAGDLAQQGASAEGYSV